MPEDSLFSQGGPVSGSPQVVVLARLETFLVVTAEGILTAGV